MINRYPYCIFLCFILFPLALLYSSEKKMSQHDLDRLFKDASSNLKLEKFLTENHFSKELKELSFHCDMDNVSFENLKLVNCSFCANLLNRCYFENVEFDNCRFGQTRILSSVFFDVVFASCKAIETSFVSSHFEDSCFYDCNLDLSNYNSSSFLNSIFKNCDLARANFYDTKAIASEIANSKLLNTLWLQPNTQFKLSNNSKNIITKPIIGLMWNFIRPAKLASIIDYVFAQTDNTNLKIYFYPADIDPDKLKEEVAKILENRTGRTSIPKYVLEHAPSSSEIDKLKEKARLLVKELDGIIFPGGEDIDPIFYGAKEEPRTKKEKDIRRTILEFALLEESIRKGIPILGICRGMQLINIYLGGDLIQNAGRHEGEQALERCEPLYDEKSLFYGISSHHQACGNLGESLIPILQYKNFIKAYRSTTYNIVGYQFHPEIYILFPSTSRLYLDNKELIQEFFDKTEQFRKKSTDAD